MKIFLLLFLSLTLFKECAANNSIGNQDKNDLLWPFGISLNMEKLNVFENGISTVTKRGNVTFKKPSNWLFGYNEVKVDMMYQDFGEKNKNESWDLSLTDVENSQPIGGLKLTRDLDISPWFRIEKSDEILLNILGANVRIQVTQNPQTPDLMVLTSVINYGDQVVKIKAIYSVSGSMPLVGINVAGQTWIGKAVWKGNSGHVDYLGYVYNFDKFKIILYLKDKDLRLQLNYDPDHNSRAIFRFYCSLNGDSVMYISGGYSEFDCFCFHFEIGREMCSVTIDFGGPISRIFELGINCKDSEPWVLNVDRLTGFKMEGNPYFGNKSAEFSEWLVNSILLPMMKSKQIKLNLIDKFQNDTHGFRGEMNATLDFDEMVGNINITIDEGPRFDERMTLRFEIDMKKTQCWQLTLESLTRQTEHNSAVTSFDFPFISQIWDDHRWLTRKFRRGNIWPYRYDIIKMVGDLGAWTCEYKVFRTFSVKISPLSKSNGPWEVELKEHKKNYDSDTFHIVNDGQTFTVNGIIPTGYDLPYPLSFHHDIVGDIKRGSLLLTRSNKDLLFQLQSTYVNSKPMEILYRRFRECNPGKILFGFDELGEFFLGHRSPICVFWGPPDREEQSWRFSLSTNYEDKTPYGYDILFNTKLKIHDKLDTSLKLHTEDSQDRHSFSSDFYNAPQSVLRTLLSMLKDFVLDSISSFITSKNLEKLKLLDYGSYY